MVSDFVRVQCTALVWTQTKYKITTDEGEGILLINVCDCECMNLTCVYVCVRACVHVCVAVNIYSLKIH